MDEVITEALLLDRVPYGERDLILTLLTRQRGLVSAIAKSSRGSRRRFGGALDLFVVFSARLRMRQPPRLSTLIEAEVVKVFPGIFDDLTRLQVAHGLITIARDLLRDAPSDEASFEGLCSALSTLEKVAPERAPKVLLDFCLTILRLLGHTPTMGICPSCGRSLKATDEVVLVDGGNLLCKACGPEGESFSASLLDPDRTLKAEEVVRLVTRLCAFALGRPYELPLQIQSG